MHNLVLGNCIKLHPAYFLNGVQANTAEDQPKMATARIALPAIRRIHPQNLTTHLRGSALGILFKALKRQGRLHFRRILLACIQHATEVIPACN